MLQDQGLIPSTEKEKKREKKRDEIRLNHPHCTIILLFLTIRPKQQNN
jgi:hypothetical protein